MNFKPELLAKILLEEKTQTRRPVKPDEVFTPDLDTWDKGMPIEVYTTKDILRPSGEHWYYRFNRRYVVGKDYAACPGRGKKQLGRIEIVRIRCEDVRSISDEDVRAEGFTSKYEFFRVWCGFYDPKALLNPNSISKQVVMDTAKDFPDVQAAKYLEDWERITLAGRDVEMYLSWAIDFKLVK